MSTDYMNVSGTDAWASFLLYLFYGQADVYADSIDEWGSLGPIYQGSTWIY
jgi:hypothetical protein